MIIEKGYKFEYSNLPARPKDAVFSCATHMKAEQYSSSCQVQGVSCLDVGHGVSIYGVAAGPCYSKAQKEDRLAPQKALLNPQPWLAAEAAAFSQTGNTSPSPGINVCGTGIRRKHREYKNQKC